jgi:hypothetical protein
MWVRLIPPAGDGGQGVRDAARVVLHELMHVYGYRHDQWRDDGFETTWAEALLGAATLPLAPVRMRPRRDVVAERRSRLEALAVRLERRLRSTRTRLATVRRRLAGYERRAASRPKAAEVTT